ncbi:MAG: hypothetical protein JO257_23185 [Deltaproteobacteria bacterium]|nr:hypothetical protein [Deltaproteobacteria bacterium]
MFVAITGVVYSAYRIAPPDRLGEPARMEVLASLRAAMQGQEAPAPTIGPVAVTVWLNGRSLARVDGDDVAAAGAQLRANTLLRAQDLAHARIQVDVIHGHAPLGKNHPLVAAFALPGVSDALAVNPGIDGIAAQVGDKTIRLLPHELVSAKLLASNQPSDVVPDFAMGADLSKIRMLVALRAGKHEPVPVGDLYRFRTDTFVESPDHGFALPLYRGVPPAPALTGAALRAAALDGGRYLVAHQAANGRYLYEHDLVSGQKTDPRSVNYSMPRHAGTTYFLAELYRITKEDWLREPIERAFQHLADLLAAGHCGGTLPDGTPFDCVLDRNESVSQLGSTALAVVALVEYERATGDPRYRPLATKLAAFILYMQRPDGSFRHLYNPKTRQPDDKAELLYYSGEAALALARMYAVTGDARYAQAAERGLDWLVDWYDFFLGGFFYGEEHWTCIAAEAIWPAVKNPKYQEFCDGYGEFLRAQQPQPGDFPDEDDLAGAYNFTPFVPPYNTPAGSRTEAMISAYLLGKHHGDPDPAIAAQIRAALQYALGQQIRPDDDFDAAGSADGGMPGSPIDRSVRIDYVQHVCSAMIRASEWIDQQGP